MRCGCMDCGAFMIHADGDDACVCPECGRRCTACLGTNTVVSRDRLKNLAFTGWISRDNENAKESLEKKAVPGGEDEYRW